MSKRGLPTELKMRHDFHYVEELSARNNVIGRTILIEKIEPNPEQPRTEIGDLSELIASIKEKGVLEPLLVKPLKTLDSWMIIAGERRWRAAKEAGLKEVPCIELDVDEKEIAEIALIENLQRKDLTVWEEADALAALSKRFGYTHEEIAKKIGKSRSTITESLTIAGLPQFIREKCLEASVSSKAVILQIARQIDDQAALEAIEKIKNGADSDSAKENEARQNQKTQQKSVQSIDNLRKFPDFPVKKFSYAAPQNEFKFELKLKKPSDKRDLIEVIKKILNELENEV